MRGHSFKHHTKALGLQFLRSVGLRTSLTVVLFFGAALIVHPALGAPDDGRPTHQKCIDALLRVAGFHKTTESPAQTTVNRLAKPRPESNFRRTMLYPARQTRDYARYMLQIFNRHPFPIVSIDESPFALAWAKAVAGTLTDAQRANVNIQEISGGLISTITRATNYDNETKTALAALEATDARIQELEKALLGVDFGAHSIQIADETPNRLVFEATTARAAPTTGKKDGVIDYVALQMPTIDEATLNALYFANTPQLRLALSDMRQYRKQLEIYVSDRVKAQAVLLKKIETYMHALKRELSAQGKSWSTNSDGQALKEISAKIRELTGNDTDILSMVQAMYTDGLGMKNLKPESSPPTWAWQAHKWYQLRFEITALYEKDILTVFFNKDSERFKKLEAFVKSLSPEERDRIGLGTAGRVVNALRSRPRVAKVLVYGVPLLTGAGGLTGMVNAGYQMIWADSIAKNECAKKPSPSDFAECAKAYLESKFPHLVIQSMEELAQLVNENGELLDPKLSEELSDLYARRHRYQYQQNLNSAVSDAILLGISKADMDGETYRAVLTSTIEDEVFEDRLINRDPSKGFLTYKFGLQMAQARVREQVQQVLNCKDETCRNTALHLLEREKFTQNLAKELRELVEDRTEFLQVLTSVTTPRPPLP